MSGKLDPPITFRQVAVLLYGPKDVRNNSRKLKRIVLARESRIQKKIALRDRAGGVRWVTVGSIRRYLPELLSSRVDSIAALIRDEMQGIYERLATLENEQRKRR
jgi:hypothetical protein